MGLAARTVPASTLISDVFAAIPDSIDEFLRMGVGKCDDMRVAGVHDWMRGAGGAEKALAISPLIAFIRTDGSVKLDDGWHRLAVAYYKYGITQLNTVCSVVLNPESELNHKVRRYRESVCLRP